MKRILALLLALLMALALVACGGSSTPPAEGEDATNGDTKVLRVAMECAYAPYNWKQSTDANGAVPIAGTSEFAYGYDVMMAKHIAETLGYELEIYAYDWEAIIPAVQSGVVDLAICGQSITSDRLEMVDFTEPYYYASIVVLTDSESAFAGATNVSDLAGATAVSQMNTVWNDVCVPQIPDVNALPGMESAPAMLVSLTSGMCDIVVTDQPTGLAAVAAYPNLKPIQFDGAGDFEVSDEEINIGISLKKGNTELLEAVNSVLAEMTEADYVDMMNQAISVQPLSDDGTTPDPATDDADKPTEVGGTAEEGENAVEPAAE